MFDSLSSLANSKIKVFVSGASGFLGQYVVKLLQEEDHSVESIVCYDLKPYENTLAHNTDKPMKIVNGDIRDEPLLLSSLEGINCIIHCAGLVCYDLHCNDNDFYAINVEGTEALIDAAVKANVKYFVHVSDTSAVCGNDPIYYGAENTIMIPKKHVLEAYGHSKYESELRAAKSNGCLLKNGVDRLRTVVIRPSLLYGENDQTFITEMIRMAKQSKNGTLQRTDNIFTRTQTTYVGNAAWACLKAQERLRIDGKIGGEEFFINDDTPVEDPFEFAKPFLEANNLKLSEKAIPFWLLIIAISMMNFLVFLIEPFYQYKIPEKYNHKKIRYLNTSYFFNRTKAILRLGYEPRFTPEESMKKSMEYYAGKRIL